MRPEVDARYYDRWARHAHENPLLRRYLETRDGRAYRFSDVTTPSELHALTLYRELYEPLGVEHQIAFVLPASPEHVLALALSRGGRDYSNPERDFVELARPFLIQAYRNALAYELLREGEAGTAGGALVQTLVAAGLTTREAEVVRLVALGGSNRHVGEVLAISDRTVGKHLERGYRKLGVGDRSSAAARAWELASAPRTALRADAGIAS
jgi:ATP/maltotriose-dependent transcriptional regulator MalT